MAGRFSVEAVFKAVDRVTAPVTRMQNRINKFTRSTAKGLRTVDSALNTVVGSLKRGTMTAVKFGTVGLAAISTGVGLLVRQFSKIEDAQAAFTPLLGSAERARDMVQALNETAATTPFQFEQLAGSANQLLPVMNGNIQDTIKTMRMLGDTAGGNAQKLDSITRGFTKAMLKGKVDMESLNMIAEAGVPIFTELAESMGTEVNEAFFKMISAGKVATTDLTKAFEKMTSEDKIFFGGMEIASKTTSGLFSTLKDNIGLTAAEIGSVLAPTIKDLIRQLIDISQRVREWVKNNKELLNQRVTDFINALSRGFKFLSENGATIAKVIGGVVALSLAIKTLTVAMAAFNLVASLNPLSLIVISVAALSAGIAALASNIDSIISGFENMNPTLRLILAPLEAIARVIKFIKESGEFLGGKIGKFLFEQFGGGGADTNIVSPQERTARSIEEKRNTSTAEITLTTEQGTTANVTGGKLGGNIKLQPSGSF
jgi:tape measure domain-containing protein